MATKQITPHLYRLRAEALRGGVMALHKLVVYLGRSRCSSWVFDGPALCATLTSRQRRLFARWLYRNPYLPEDMRITWHQLDTKEGKIRAARAERKAMTEDTFVQLKKDMAGSISEALVAEAPKFSREAIREKVTSAIDLLRDQAKLLSLTPEELALLVDYRLWKRTTSAAGGVFHWRVRQHEGDVDQDHAQAGA